MIWNFICPPHVLLNPQTKAYPLKLCLFLALELFLTLCTGQFRDDWDYTGIQPWSILVLRSPWNWWYWHRHDSQPFSFYSSPFPLPKLFPKFSLRSSIWWIRRFRRVPCLPLLPFLLIFIMNFSSEYCGLIWGKITPPFPFQVDHPLCLRCLYLNPFSDLPLKAGLANLW